jgi:hypothetical protein
VENLTAPFGFARGNTKIPAATTFGGENRNRQNQNQHTFENLSSKEPTNKKEQDLAGTLWSTAEACTSAENEKGSTDQKSQQAAADKKSTAKRTRAREKWAEPGREIKTGTGATRSGEEKPTREKNIFVLNFNKIHRVHHPRSLILLLKMKF